MSARATALYRRVCELLFAEWDPIGVNGLGGPQDEYDSYAAGLMRLIEGGADEYRVAHRLGELARVSMGISHVDQERDRRVARQLIDLVRRAD